MPNCCSYGKSSPLLIVVFIICMVLLKFDLFREPDEAVLVCVYVRQGVLVNYARYIANLYHSCLLSLYRQENSASFEARDSYVTFL